MSSILGAVSAYISIQTQPIRVCARGACALPRSLANPPSIPIKNYVNKQLKAAFAH